MYLCCRHPYLLGMPNINLNRKSCRYLTEITSQQFIKPEKCQWLIKPEGWLQSNVHKVGWQHLWHFFFFFNDEDTLTIVNYPHHFNIWNYRPAPESMNQLPLYWWVWLDQSHISYSKHDSSTFPEKGTSTTNSDHHMHLTCSQITSFEDSLISDCLIFLPWKVRPPIFINLSELAISSLIHVSLHKLPDLCPTENPPQPSMIPAPFRTALSAIFWYHHHGQPTSCPHPSVSLLCKL